MSLREDGEAAEALARDCLTEGVAIARTYFAPGKICDDGVIVRITRVPAEDWDEREPDLIVQRRLDEGRSHRKLS